MRQNESLLRLRNDANSQIAFEYALQHLVTDDVSWCSESLAPPFPHHRYAVRIHGRQIEIVQYGDYAAAASCIIARDIHNKELVAYIEVCDRLVQKQIARHTVDYRLPDPAKRSCQLDRLLLTARKILMEAAGKAVEADVVECFSDKVFSPFNRTAGATVRQAEAHDFTHGEWKGKCRALWQNGLQHCHCPDIKIADFQSVQTD